MPDHQKPDPVAAYRFFRHGRSAATLLAVAGWFAGLGLLWWLLAASPWLLALLALPVLPALMDLWRNPRSDLSLDRQQITWRSGSLQGSVKLTEISHVRLTTRWDFSVRATLVLTDGRHMRLPPQTTPPHAQLDAALAAHGIRTERHHFTRF